MGRFIFTLIAGTLAAGSAQASSIVTLEATREAVTPSMVVLGAPAEPAMVKEETQAGLQLSYPYPGSVAPHLVAKAQDGGPAGDGPSIVSVKGADGVSEEKTAAIGNDDAKAGREAHFSPMVIRGGIVGDAFVRDTGPAAAPAPETATAAAPDAAVKSAPGRAPSSAPAEAAPDDAPAPSNAPALSGPR